MEKSRELAKLKEVNLFEILNKRNKKSSGLEENGELARISKISKKPQKWSKKDTEIFYKCLEIFGVDFSLIKEILTEKTTKQLLRKYHKEKKKFPDKIEKILKNHENIFLRKDNKYKKFIDDLFFNNPDFSIEKIINQNIPLLIEQTQQGEILPLNFYLNNLE
jgi:hypothetical protein